MSLRRSPPPRRRPPGASSFPIVPIVIAVVAIGFAIGAAIPALRGAGHRQAGVALASPSPTVALSAPAATRAPSTPTAYQVPTAPPASPTAAPTATLEPSPLPSASASASPSAGSPRPTRSPAPAAVTPVASARPVPHPKPSARLVTLPKAPAVRDTPLATTVTSAARPTPLASGAQDAADLENLASASVRRYLEALIAGNEGAARALLDAPAGSNDAQLGEESFVDRATEIVDVRPRATSADEAVVEVDLQTSKGAYFDRFHVRRNQNGVVIVEHSFIKP